MRNIGWILSAALAATLAACGGEPGTREGEGADTVGAPAATPSIPEPAPVAGDSAAVERASDAVEPVPAPPPATEEMPAGGAATADPMATEGAHRAPVTPAGSETPAAQDAEAILRRTSEAYEGIRSLQADFTMVVENRLLRSRTTSRGTLYQRRPDRILLDFAEPDGDVIVSDGSHFWIYYPSVDARQVIRAPASQAGAGGVDLQAQFIGDPVARFDYTVHGREAVDGRDAWVVTLVPKQSGAGYEQLKVWIDTQDSLVRRFELTEGNGTVRHFELRGIERNPTLGDDLFRFTPPADARIVDRG